MIQKKIFLAFVVITTVSLLLHHGGHLESWTMEAFYLGCPSHCSIPSPCLEQPRHGVRPWQPNAKVDIVGYDLPANLSQGTSSQDQENCLKLIMPEVQYTQVLLHSQSLLYRRSYQQRPPQLVPGSGPGSTSTLRPAGGAPARGAKPGQGSSPTQAL